MTLDDSTLVSMREAIRRGAEEDAARELAEYAEQRMLEDPATEDARWRATFRRMRWERPTVHYLRPIPDDRCFAVEGDLIEQARRDADPPRDVA